MIVRYQMGPFDNRFGSWDALDLAIRLMQRLEPDAEIIVTCQGTIHQRLENVRYESQKSLSGGPYCDGRHVPLRYGTDRHEVWLDNDHIMWALPEGWKRFKARRDAALVWRCDWKYYGSYGGDISAARGDDWDASAGMWGLPPGCVMPKPVYKRTDNLNLDEYGWVVKFLAEWPEHEYVTQEEVPIYCPDHNALKHRNVIGTHGVHLNGLNRGWNGRGKTLLDELRREWL